MQLHLGDLSLYYYLGMFQKWSSWGFKEAKIFTGVVLPKQLSRGSTDMTFSYCMCVSKDTAVTFSVRVSGIPIDMEFYTVLPDYLTFLALHHYLDPQRLTL